MTGVSRVRTIHTRFTDKFTALCVDNEHHIVYLYRDAKKLIERYNLVDEVWLKPKAYAHFQLVGWEEVVSLTIVPDTASKDGAMLLVAWNSGVIELFDFESGDVSTHFDGRIMGPTERMSLASRQQRVSGGSVVMRLMAMCRDSKGRLYLLYASRIRGLHLDTLRSYLFRVTILNGKADVETVMRCTKKAAFECQNMCLSPDERWLYVTQRGRVMRLSTCVDNSTMHARDFAKLLPTKFRPKPVVRDRDEIKEEDDIVLRDVAGDAELAPPLRELPFVGFCCDAEEVLWMKQQRKGPSYDNPDDPVFGILLAIAQPSKHVLYVAEPRRIRKVYMHQNGDIKITHFIGKGKTGLVDGDPSVARFKGPRALHYVPKLEVFVCLDRTHLRVIDVPVELEHMQFVRDRLMQLRFDSTRGNKMFLDEKRDEEKRDEGVAAKKVAFLPQDVCAEVMLFLYGTDAEVVFEGRFGN